LSSFHSPHFQTKYGSIFVSESTFPSGHLTAILLAKSAEKFLKKPAKKSPRKKPAKKSLRRKAREKKPAKKAHVNKGLFTRPISGHDFAVS
jgi:hypothetical protein